MVISENKNYGYLYRWYLDLKPSMITFYNTKTGERIVEPSYVAMEIKGERTYTDPETGKTIPSEVLLLGPPLAVGKKALAYQGRRDMVVISPFRDGQIANYGLALYFLRKLICQVLPKVILFKPIICIRAQEQTSEGEERALIDISIQAGGRRVYLYKEPLSVILDSIAQKKIKEFKDPIVIHIEPQD